MAELGAEGRRRVGTDRHIAAIVARAGKLTAQQVETLRSVLPEPDTDISFGDAETVGHA